MLDRCTVVNRALPFSHGGSLEISHTVPFTPGGRSCLWNITGGEGQRIEVSLLDTSLRNNNLFKPGLVRYKVEIFHSKILICSNISDI